MKKSSRVMKKLLAIVLTVTFIVTLFGIVPVVEAVEPAWNNAFVNKLISEKPLGSGQLYVGYDKQDITPKPIYKSGDSASKKAAIAEEYGLSESEVVDGFTGIPMGGYGLESDRLAIVGGTYAGKTTADKNKYYTADIEQPIYTIATAMMDAEGNIVLSVVNDMLNSTRYDDLRTAIKKGTGVPKERIMISSTHSHSTPSADSSNQRVKAVLNDYNAYFDAQTTLACQNAIKDLAPATMSKKTVDIVDGTKRANFVRNYDTGANQYDYTGNKVAEGNNHGSYYFDKEATTPQWKDVSRAGHITDADYQMQLIRFVRSDSNNILLCNFQGHPLRLSNGNSRVVSSDVVGALRDALAYSDVTTGYRVAYYNGAGGNINFSTNMTSGSAMTSDAVADDWKVTVPSGRFYLHTTKSTATDKYIDVTKSFSFSPVGSIGSDTATKGGITERQLGRIANYYVGNFIADRIINNFSSGWETVSASKVKANEYLYSALYHAPENEETTKTATYISMLWNATTTNLAKMIYGSYNFSATQIAAFSVIKDTASETFKTSVNNHRKEQGLAELTGTDLQYVSNFVQRVQDTIIGNRRISASEYYYDKSSYTTVATRRTALNTWSVLSKKIASISDVLNAKRDLANKLGRVANYYENLGSSPEVSTINSVYHSNALSSSRVNNAGQNYTARFTVFSVGDITFASLPGELFDTNGKFIKENTSSKMTFVMGYSNGSSGYFPSAYGHLYGSYESDTTVTNQGDAEMFAGILSDYVGDSTFEGNVYNLSKGGTVTLTKANGTPLYSYSDSFDYATYGAKYGDNNLERFSYQNISTSWKSSDESVATVSQDGTITAVGDGIATITVVHTGGNSVGTSYTNSASCTVKVNGNHNQCEECGTLICNNFSHKKYNYTAWNNSTSLPTEAGHYFLNCDVNLTSAVNVSKEVYLCLNGHKISTTSANGVFGISNGGYLNISDCTGKGFVTANSELTLSSGNGLITVQTGGKFRLVNGTVDAAKVTANYGPAIHIAKNSEAQIAGGAVIGGTATASGAAINNSGTLEISGGTVQGGSAVSYGGAINSGDNFYMTGGTVQGGTANGKTGSMGGIAFISGYNNIMTGGVIQGGEAPYGGTLTLDSLSGFTLDGGTIGGGVASLKGGSVYLCSTSEFNLKSGTIRDGSTTIGGTSARLGGNVCLATAGAVFNMTGGSIENGECYGFGGNVYIVKGAAFNMENGTVTGGKANRDDAITNAGDKGGHGGNFQIDGILNLSGGTVTDGIANGHGGGNISLYTSGAKVNMTGGTIKNGSSTMSAKGNVYLWYHADENAFDMSGGNITDDSTFCRVPGYYGGGVYIATTSAPKADSLLKVSGTVRISGNHNTQVYDAENAKNIFYDCNVYLESGKIITVGDVSHTSKIGIVMKDTTGIFSIGGASNRMSFSSDEGYYVVKNENNLAISTEPDETEDPISAVRDGAPSDIPLEKPDIIRDGFDHYNIPAVGGTVNLSDYYSGITLIEQISGGSNVTLSGTVATGKAIGSETFRVTYSEGATATAVVAVGHYHCVECGTFGCTIHENRKFTGVDSIVGTQSGYYYLNSDINLSTVITISSGRDYNLCLNGHTLSGTSDIGRIFTTVGDLSVTDCSNAGADNGNGKIVSYSNATEGGGVVSIGANSTFKLFRGTLDASDVKASSSCNGAAIYSKGTLYINGGKIIGGNPASYGGALCTDKSYTTYTEMNGGVIDCYNVVSTRGSAIYLNGPKASFVMNNGRIIGGRQSGSGAIYVLGTSNNPATFTLNGGVIQDGMSVKAVTYKGGTPSSSVANAGNVELPNGYSVFNMYGGILANGVCYGFGGNINVCSSSTFNMYGGTIMGGKALSPLASTAKTSIVGGNIRGAGNVTIYDGLITDGFCEGSYGANIVINNTGSNVKMYGGTIKNGISSSSVGSNVAVWFEAGSADNTKVAFDMSGGIITDDEELSIPYGYYSGGLALIRNSGGNYCNSTRISGSAKICGNIGNDVYVDGNHNDGKGEAVLVFGELTEGADIRISVSTEKIIGTNVTPSSVKYIRMNESVTTHSLVYDENAQTLSTVYISRNNANRFIERYLRAPDGSYYTEVTKNNFSVIKQSNAYFVWNNQSDSENAIINAVYNGLCGVSDVGALLKTAEEFISYEPYEEFIDTYLRDSSGNIIKAATLENCEQIIACEAAYNALSPEQRALADAAIGTPVTTLIANAKAIKQDYETAKGFADTYFSNGAGGYYFNVNYDNFEKIASARGAWNSLTTAQKTYANGIIGSSAETLITAAEALVSDKASGKAFINKWLYKDNVLIAEVNLDNYAELKSNIVDAGSVTEWKQLNESKQYFANEYYKTTLASGKTFEKFTEDVNGYVEMTKVNVIISRDKKNYVFYSGLDAAADSYQLYGFEIDHGEDFTLMLADEYGEYDEVAEILKTCENKPKKASEISDVTEQTYFCYFYLYKLDYNKPVKIRSVIVKEDGTEVYGAWQELKFGDPSATKVKINGSTVITDSDYDESDFFD